MTDKPILAYWFALADKQGRVYSPKNPLETWVEGQSRTLRGKIVPCERGYHASPTLWDALTYAPGPVACLVELSGTIVPHGGDKWDKYAASSRKLIRAVNVERELREFAADCAEHVLPIFERERPGDDRLRKAIEAARAYARGEISKAELAVVRDVADAAARDAARAANILRRAPRADAAADAVSAATATTTMMTTTAAAWAAASARDAAARAAADARDAVSAAERAWQRERFEARFGHIFEEVTV